MAGEEPEPGDDPGQTRSDEQAVNNGRDPGGENPGQGRSGDPALTGDVASADGLASAGGASDAPPAKGARSLLSVAALAVALAAADTYVVVLALPDMMAGAGLGIDALNRATPIISGFLLGYIAVLPLIGRLADLVPRHRILQICLAVFVVGSAITAVAVDLQVMVAGRVLQGLGGGGLVPATLAIVADVWPRGRRGTPLGVVGAVQELGSVLGPLLGAAILLVTTWRGIFWVNVALGLIFMLTIWLISARSSLFGADVGGVSRQDREEGTRSSLFGADVGGVSRQPRKGNAHASRWLGWGAVVAGTIGTALATLALLAPNALVTSVAWGEPFIPFGDSDSRVWTPIGVAALVFFALAAGLTGPRWFPTLRQADVIGALFIAIALGCLVLTFSSAEPEVEVLGPWGLWLLPVGGVALVAFLVRQRTAANPLIQPGVVRRRVIPALVVSLLVGAALVAVVIDVPLLARLDPANSQTDAAFVLIRFLVAVPIGAVLGGMALRRLGPGVVAAPGMAITSCALWVMSGWDRGSLDEIVASTIVLALAGFGLGLAIAPVNDAALADAVQTAHGAVSSLVVVARMVGMVVGLALLTAIGLRQYYSSIEEVPDPTDSEALLDAAVVQVQTVFTGAAICAGLAAITALFLGLKILPVRERHRIPG